MMVSSVPPATPTPNNSTTNKCQTPPTARGRGELKIPSPVAASNPSRACCQQCQSHPSRARHPPQAREQAQFLPWLLEWAPGAGMGAQAAQPSWQLPMLPADTVGGRDPGEEHPEGDDTFLCHLPRGQQNCQSRGMALARPWSCWHRVGDSAGHRGAEALLWGWDSDIRAACPTLERGMGMVGRCS